MKRAIDPYLLKWKKDPHRKVMLVRGARQVGKTYSIRQLGKTFQYFIEINFEADRDLHTFFAQNLDPEKICEQLSIYFSTPIIPGKTLLFFDEIQACPRALSSLRFFYEKIPELHVIAAGSLLEFALEDIPSYGVGRIQSMYLYPMRFSEFLIALNKEPLWKQITKSDFHNPPERPFHSQLLELVTTFQLIGGMPKVVSRFVETGNILECMYELDDLITAYIDDFAKYRARSPVACLQEVFQSISNQTGAKFKYSNVPSQSTHNTIKASLDLLIHAGLAYKIVHTNARGLPLGGEINLRKFKVVLFDSGIYQRTCGLDLKQYIVADKQDMINKGSLSEAYVGIQLLHAQSPRKRPSLYYWHREAKSSNAEVDYIIERNNAAIPIEVKAGTKGQMQSMYIFLKTRPWERGIRVSMENFARVKNIEILPIYAVEKLFIDE